MTHRNGNGRTPTTTLQLYEVIGGELRDLADDADDFWQSVALSAQAGALTPLAQAEILMAVARWREEMEALVHKHGLVKP